MTNRSGRNHKLWARYHGFLHRALWLYRHIPVNEFCSLQAVRRTQKCGLYMSFSGQVLQLQVTFVLCTANRVHENCLCRGGTEEHQTKQSDMARRIAYDQRIPKLSGRLACCWCCFCSVRRVSPTSIFIILGIMQEYCRRLLVLPDSSMYSTFSWISIASLVPSNHRLLFPLWRYILKY